LAGEIDDIRARINIVDLVGQRVQLKKTGKNYTGLCPFHDDKRPSFTVTPQLGRYKCFSCGEGGDIFTWVMKTQNVDFGEALQILAPMAGVELSNRPTGQSRSEKSQQLEIMEEALRFFREQLGRSATARDYLNRRGLDEAVVSEWELGYAPDVGEALAVHLYKKGFPLALCRTLFLVEEDPSGGYYDKFRGRLMFPIRDERQDLVAFGGRVLGDGMPKYINSSDTPLYRKGRVLYGMHRASKFITKMKPRQMVLCEGYLDVIACHRAGVRGAVASLGTALSEDHAKLMKRWCDEVVILYDADSAGQKAAERAIEVLKAESVLTRVALMPSGEDPDTLLRSQGPGAVEAAVKQATLPTDFKLDQLIASHPEKGQAFWDAAAEIIAQSSHLAELERHIERVVSQHSGVEDQLYLRESFRKQVLGKRRTMARHRRDEPPPIGEPPPSFEEQERTPLNVFEATIVAGLMSTEFRKHSHGALLRKELYETGEGRLVAETYGGTFSGGAPTGEAATWLPSLDLSVVAAFERVSVDQRFAMLKEEDVLAAIKKLEDRSKRRKFGQIRSSKDFGLIQETLKDMKPKREPKDGDSGGASLF